MNSSIHSNRSVAQIQSSNYPFLQSGLRPAGYVQISITQFVIHDGRIPHKISLNFNSTATNSFKVDLKFCK